MRSLTTTMAAVGPVVIFGVLYMLAIEPQRAAARAVQQELADANAKLGKERAFVRRAPSTNQLSPISQFESRTPDTGSAGEVPQALEALLNSPAVGGVADLSIETGAATFGPQLVSTPVTMSFDARYDQIGRFFWNLRTLPTTFELRSVQLTTGRAPSTHASVVLFVRQRKADLSSAPEEKPFTPAAEVPSAALARRERVPPQRDPVVSSILFSSRRRVALIDGRIVRVGDRVGSAVVRSIEPDAVVIVTAEGLPRRLELDRPAFPTAGR